MEKLKKSIIQKFIIYAFALSVIESVIESLFEDWIILKVSDPGWQSTLSLFLYAVISILFFALFGLMYARDISKMIEKETARQVGERNLLFANIAHDLKTPMTSIKGFAQALNDGMVREDEKKTITQIICDKAVQIDEIITLLFWYTKLTTNEYQMQLVQLDICKVVRNTIASQYEMFEENGMELDIHIPEHPIECMMDNLEISRAINNLLVNAYTHNENESKVGIYVESMTNGHVKIVIADNGKEINPSLEEHLFEPFVCEDDSRNSKNGSGLGLAITKKIVEKHKGKIYIEHNSYGYTKGFVIEL